MSQRNFCSLLLLGSAVLMSACGGSDGASGGTEPLRYYTATANAGAGGTVTPASQRLVEGSSAQFSISPQAGYQIASATGCNGSLTGQSYKTAALTADCTVSVSFRLNSYAVTATAGPGGSISPALQQVEHGNQAELQITTDNGYRISTATGCGGSLNGDRYLTAAVTADCAVAVHFALKSYEVSATAGPGGSISPAQQQVEHGGRAVLQLSTEAGYRLASVNGCDGVLNGLVYTTAEITAPCEVQASFSVLQAPVAVIKAEAELTDNQLLLLDGSASSADPSLSLSYQWQLVTDNNLTLTLERSTEQNARVQLPDLMQDHHLTVRLTVTDSSGATAQNEQQTLLKNAEHNHNVILRVVRVTEDWMPYSDPGGWTNAVVLKQSDFVKYYEVAIWEETKSVQLYAFPNSYDPLFGLHVGQPKTDAEKIAYREQYAVLRFDGFPPEELWEQRNEFLITAFERISDYLVQAHPNSDHHLMFNGHGGPGGRLFEGMVSYQGAGQLLGNYQQQLGRKLGVIDMGGPCNKGSFSDVENFCRHARYYVASDLENGGYQFDNWTYEQYLETHPEHQYHSFFAVKANLEQQLKQRIDITQQRYLYAWQDMINRQLMQANYLYSCDQFSQFKPLFDSFMQPQQKDYLITEDLKAYLQLHQANTDLLDAFDRVILHSATNKAAFDWPEQRHGMLMPDPWLPATP
ncbi:hypothetical protein EMM73_03510 [Rheinheimera sediminis]|uniref:InlB B-repeat-containing protein n=1 Tax=Rheinheimera sp. YQF-1 TaxID=2499626 RepID=UPI000FDAC708|nr:hypothetical protein [Rheinheimera sp. YQF-1]RVT47831.1 hypothetical protein EMM73_03510 [Rheinheimera sp. YQF-1]